MTNRSAFLGFAGVGALLLLLAPMRGGPLTPVPGTGAAASAPAPSRLTNEFVSGRSLIAAWSGVSADSGLPTRPDLDVLVATLPDPVDSYQDWTYDASLSAIRRAFEATGYVLDRFWISRATDSVVGMGGLAVPSRFMYPDVLLFRRGSNALYVLYVVHELPTSGVYREALVQALDERRDLLRDPSFDTAPDAWADLRIVGPTFSGSSASLRATVRRWINRPENQSVAVRVITGSATSPGNLVTFAGDPRFTFASTVNSDARLQAAIRALIIDSLDIDARRVALLSESSTEYGLALTAGGEEFLNISFPMNIATLRGAYERDPVEPGSGELALREPSPVEFTLEEAERSVAPRVRSRLTAPAVDVLLEQIVRTLWEHEIRLVGILATDVRDKLFLAEEIKRRLPDVQLFTYESNVLFLRAHRNRAMYGMLTVSTYPLFLENQRWMQRYKVHNQLPFGSEGAQGVFNATLVQLDNEPAMAEYGIPGMTSNAPPVWLTVVGGRSMVPLSYMSLDPDDAYLYRTKRPTYPDRGRLRRTTLSFGGWSLFFVVGVVLIGIAIRSILQAPGRFDEFRSAIGALRPVRSAKELGGDTLQQLVHRGSLFLHREIYHGFTLVALLGVFLPVAALLYADMAQFTETSAQRREQLFIGVVTVLMAVALIRVIGYAVRMAASFGAEWHLLVKRALGHERPQGTWLVETLLRSAIVTTGLVYLWFLAMLSFDVVELSWSGSESDWWIFFYRAIQIDGGISPLLPLVLIAAGMGVWAAWHLRRIELLLEHSPYEHFATAHLPADGETPVSRVSQGLRVGVRQVRSRFQQEFSEKVNVGAFIAILLILCALFLYGASFDPGRSAWASLLRAVTVGLLMAAVFVLWTYRWARPSGGVPPERDIMTHIGESVQSVRDALFFVVPHRWAWLVLLVLVSAAGWLWAQFGRTFDGVRLSGTFTVLFQFGVLAMLASIPWAATRLLVVWHHLQRFLANVGRLPLISAFDRLPPRIAQLTRLTVFRPKTSNLVEPVAAMQVDHLRTMYDRNGDRFGAGRCGDPELAGEIAEFVKTLPKTPDPTGVPTVAMLEQVHKVLAAAWHREPNEGEVRELLRIVKEPDFTKDPNAASTVSRFRRTFAGPLRLWLRCAEEYVALWIVHFTVGVLEQLRRLALFLLLALMFAAALLTSYPFHPQSRLKLLFIFVVVGTVLSIFYVMIQMGRSEVLSRVTKTEPGRIKWDTHFVFNIAIFGAVPLLSLLSAEFPAVRAVFGMLVQPLLDAFTTL